MRIACLHTAESNVAVFEAARPDGVRLSHAVRPDLLAAAEAEGLTAAIAAATVEALGALDGDAVLLTCSTLGPAAGPAGAQRRAGDDPPGSRRLAPVPRRRSRGLRGVDRV